MAAGFDQIRSVLRFPASLGRRQSARQRRWDMPKASGASNLRILRSSRRASPDVLMERITNRTGVVTSTRWRDRFVGAAGKENDEDGLRRPPGISLGVSAQGRLSRTVSGSRAAPSAATDGRDAGQGSAPGL
jgi:hypothetical protein